MNYEETRAYNQIVEHLKGNEVFKEWCLITLGLMYGLPYQERLVMAEQCASQYMRHYLKSFFTPTEKRFRGRENKITHNPLHGAVHALLVESVFTYYEEKQVWNLLRHSILDRRTKKKLTVAQARAYFYPASQEMIDAIFPQKQSPTERQLSSSPPVGDSLDACIWGRKDNHYYSENFRRTRKALFNATRYIEFLENLKIFASVVFCMAFIVAGIKLYSAFSSEMVESLRELYVIALAAATIPFTAMAIIFLGASYGIAKIYSNRYAKEIANFDTLFSLRLVNLPEQAISCDQPHQIITFLAPPEIHAEIPNEPKDKKERLPQIIDKPEKENIEEVRAIPREPKKRNRKDEPAEIPSKKKEKVSATSSIFHENKKYKEIEGQGVKPGTRFMFFDKARVKLQIADPIAYKQLKEASMYPRVINNKRGGCNGLVSWVIPFRPEDQKYRVLSTYKVKAAKVDPRVLVHEVFEDKNRKFFEANTVVFHS